MSDLRRDLARIGRRADQTLPPLDEGKRDTLLRLLAHAGRVVSPEDQARIATCTDTATLDRWFDNALTAKTAADVLS